MNPGHHEAEAAAFEKSAEGRQQRAESLAAQGLCTECSGDGWVGYWRQQQPRNVFVREACPVCQPPPPEIEEAALLDFADSAELQRKAAFDDWLKASFGDPEEAKSTVSEYTLAQMWAQMNRVRGTRDWREQVERTTREFA